MAGRRCTPASSPVISPRQPTERRNVLRDGGFLKEPVTVRETGNEDVKRDAILWIVGEAVQMIKRRRKSLLAMTELLGDQPGALHRR
jgi:hypothetical protein